MLDNMSASSQLVQRKRVKGESSSRLSRPAIPTPPPNPLGQETPGVDHRFTFLGNVVRPGMLLRSSAQTQRDGFVPLWAPYLEYRGGDAVMKADCILPVGDKRSTVVARALNQVGHLPFDMGEWKKSSDDELINNLRSGLHMVSMPLFVLWVFVSFCLS